MLKEPTKEEKQQLFLELLFMDVEEGGAGGNPVLAKKLAGYSPDYSTTTLLSSKVIQEGIEKKMKEFFTRTAPESAMAILSVLRNPTQLGSKDKIVAAKELLDRGGFIKVEKVEVSSGGGLFILPAKEATTDD
jgi:hypothetical protein